MNRYTVVIEEKAERQLRAVRDKMLLRNLTDRILALGSNPRPSGVKKMAGQRDKWRIRVGDWRVVYVIEDGRLVVLVVAVGLRGAVYRTM